jgi:predicted transposase/invertase (TIGR01784 family)
MGNRLITLSPDEHKEKMMTIAEQLKQIGREEGREEGAMTERLSLARNLLRMNFPAEKIAEATGLSLEEIQSLRAHGGN